METKYNVCNAIGDTIESFDMYQDAINKAEELGFGAYVNREEKVYRSIRND